MWFCDRGRCCSEDVSGKEEFSVVFSGAFNASEPVAKSTSQF